MSIYLKGAEMPTNNGYITLRIWKDGLVESIETCHSWLLPTVKAISVPPHGRLIDADAVSLDGGPYEYDEWCKWALDQYQDAPTIIPADPPKKEAIFYPQVDGITPSIISLKEDEV